MDKATLLALVSDNLSSGVIAGSDLRHLIYNHEMKNAADSVTAPPARRTSAVDVMFSIAAIVLFAAIVALIGQSWDSGSGIRIFLSSGLGVAFWAVVLLLLRSPAESDIRRGILNASLLVGSLLLIVGGFITANEFVSYDDFNFYATSFTLLLLGIAHIAFGWQIKRNAMVLVGVFLATLAFPFLVYGLLSGSSAPMFINCLVMAITGGILMYATRVAALTGLLSKDFDRAFDSIGTFIAFMSIYVASYDDSTGLLWLLVLIGGIIGLFYLSIVKQDKLMLGNGSLFLVIAIITVSFRYFDGYGVAGSLLIGALGLLGTAIVATTINRRYLRE